MNPDTGNLSPNTDNRLQAISPRFLLGVYVVLPLAVLVVVIDYLCFDWHIRQSLPNQLIQSGWLNVVFMLPHVLASVFTFADRDYLVTYAPRLAGASLAIIAGIVLVPLAFSANALMTVLTVYTAYHQIAQQAGIASIVTRNRSPIHTAWKWSGFALLLGIVAVMAIDPALRSKLFAVNPSIYYGFFALVALAYIAISAITAWRSQTRMGVYLIVANSLMMLLNGVFVALSFSILSVLIVRIVHDVTAFGFYVTHNANRNQGRPRNVISWLLQPLRLPEYVLTPALALLVAIAMTKLVPLVVVTYCLLYLAFFHYYFESVMWKNGEPHRQNVHVSSI